MAGGRPSIYSQELAENICNRLINGEGLRAICRDVDMPDVTTVIDWVNKKPEFSQQYARARELQAELMIDDILEIADDSSMDYKNSEYGEVVNAEAIQRSRLKVDTRKWLIGKMYPRKYGDKPEVGQITKDDNKDKKVIIEVVDARKNAKTE